MEQYYTSGQVARKLHVSMSTLKRWLQSSDIGISDTRNHNGWRLFSENDLLALKKYKKDTRKTGKHFNDSILQPCIIGEEHTKLHHELSIDKRFL